MADIKKIISFTKGWEGGLSNDPKDTASKTPSPYVWTDPKSKRTAPAHTNKGVTYAVFKANASPNTYQDTAKNFLQMPDDIWLLIAKKRFWDVLGLDNVKSQAVANVMFSWQWGSGYDWVPRVSTYLKTKGINWTGGTRSNGIKLASDFNLISQKLNELVSKVGEKKAFDDLTEQKKQYLLSLPNSVNPNGVYTKGWLNRLDDLKNKSYVLMSDAYAVVKKNPLITAAITATLLVGTWLVVRNFKK